MAHNCDGCKYLYLDGQGYSDYTWEETYVTCALDLNPHLPMQEPMNYRDDNVGRLRWLATMAHECDKYDAGDRVTTTPDGNVMNFTDDDEQMLAIIRDQGRHEGDIDIDECRKHETVHGGESWS